MRMHLVGTRDLVDRLAAGQRFQRHFRLQLRTEHFPLHRSSPPRHAVLAVQGTTLFNCLKFGDHYNHPSGPFPADPLGTVINFSEPSKMSFQLNLEVDF